MAGISFSHGGQPAIAAGGDMLPSLTALRFFAALLVFFSHLPGSLFYEGYTGVTFFFILSGFILSHAYGARLLHRATTSREFWLARFARVYPLHALTMLVALPAALANSSSIWSFLAKGAAQITLTQAFVPLGTVFFSFNSPSWSLSVEALFYLLFPWLILMGTRRLLVVVALVLAYHIFVGATGRGGHYLLYIFPGARLADFSIGIVLYRIFLLRSAVPPRTAALMQGVAVLSLVACYAVSSHIPQAFRYDIFYVLPMAAVVFSFAWQKGAVARAISSAWIVRLGEASFALYLVHQLVIRFATYTQEWSGLAGIWFNGVCLVTSVLLSLVLYRYFEIPAKVMTLAYGKRFIARPAPSLPRGRIA